MICGKCGMAVEDGVKFCTNCGEKIIYSTVQTPVQPSPQQTPIPQPQPQPVMQPTPAPQPQPQPVMQPASAPQPQPQPVMQPMQPQAAPAPGKKNRLPVILAVVFGVIALAVIGILVFTLKNRDTTASVNSGRETSDDDTKKPSKSSTHRALKDLKAILDETDASVSEWELSDPDDFEAFMAATEKLYDDLSDQKYRITQINGLPSNVSKACNDAYGLYQLCLDDVYKNLVFILDFMALSESIDSSDMFSIYSSFVDSYYAISCPDNLKDSWAKIGKSIDFLETYIYRTDEADQLDDSLRQSSANNHLERFVTVFTNESEHLTDIVIDELAFAIDQADLADRIIVELNDVTSMTDKNAENYVFNYDIENVLTSPKYDHINMIYPSLYNTYDSFLTVELGCMSGSKDVVIECQIPGLSQVYSQSYHIGSALTVLNIKPPAAEEKLNLDTAKDSQIKVSIREKGTGAMIDEQSFPVHIASRNDFVWYTDEFGTITQDNILCFLAPDSEAIADLKRDSIDIMTYMSDNQMNSLVGYQGPFFNYDYLGDGYYDSGDEVTAEFLTTYLQTAALMRALSEANVRYTMDVFSIDNADQHILFPDQVLERKTGLCIETSLVIASALQSAGMHTMLILPPGHAQVAVETWYGSGEYFLIETTYIPNDNAAFIDEANYYYNYWNGDCDNYPISYLSKDQWAEYLSDCYVIDCSDGSILGMTPFAY